MCMSDFETTKLNFQWKKQPSFKHKFIPGGNFFVTKGDYFHIPNEMQAPHISSSPAFQCGNLQTQTLFDT